jgi:hypothetical protein
MRQCSDELPPPEPELPFIADLDLRLGLQDRLHAAWTDFGAREWMGRLCSPASSSKLC